MRFYQDNRSRRFDQTAGKFARDSTQELEHKILLTLYQLTSLAIIGNNAILLLTDGPCKRNFINYDNRSAARER